MLTVKEFLALQNKVIDKARKNPKTLVRLGIEQYFIFLNDGLYYISKSEFGWYFLNQDKYQTIPDTSFYTLRDCKTYLLQFYI